MRDMPWPDGKGKGTWNESKVVEAAEVRKRANKPGANLYISVGFANFCMKRMQNWKKMTNSAR